MTQHSNAAVRQHAEQVKQVRTLLAHLMRCIGHPEVTEDKITLQAVEDELTTVDIADLGIFVDVGQEFEVEVKTLVRRKGPRCVYKVKGYRIGYWKHYPATRWDPPDVEDVTFEETSSMSEVLEAVARLTTRQAIDAILESTMHDYARRPEDDEAHDAEDQDAP